VSGSIDLLTALDLLGKAEARVAELEAALAPFADGSNWHHNFDGSGIIFHLGQYDRQDKEAIEAAKVAIVEGRRARAALAAVRQEKP
jgi:hypothetical protein